MEINEKKADLTAEKYISADGGLGRITRIEHTGLDLSRELDRFDEIAIGLMGKYEISLKLKEVWENLILWAWGQPSCKYDLDKSICIVGGTGSTKTITLKILHEYLHIANFRYNKQGTNRQIPTRFQWVKISELTKAYEKFGSDGLYKWLIIPNLAIDDVATESIPTYHFKASENVLEFVYNERADRFNLTHFTSNCGVDELEERYKERFISRLAGGSNIILLDSDIDYRGELRIFE